MRKHLLVAACGGFLLATILPLEAQEKNNAVGAAGTIAPSKAPATLKRKKPNNSDVIGSRPLMAVYLTAAECTSLGGSTVAEDVCNSGKACETTTENGDWKRVCLAKSE